METIKNLQGKIQKTYLKVFGRTPLQQRLDDILGEAIELHRFTDLPNLKEESGDLLSSLLQLCNECGWRAEDLLKENLGKIQKRKIQYRGLGRKLKVAIYGGAFDPLHIGHLEVAKFVLNASGIFDEVWIMPCLSHLYNKKMVSAEHRTAMCRLATRDDSRIKIFDFEIKNKLNGETYNMVKRLLDTDEAKNQYDFSLIIGLDNANTFNKWVNYRDLERMVRFVVIPRTGEKRDCRVNWYLKSPHIFLEPEKPLPEISSSKIRGLFKIYWDGINTLPQLRGHIDSEVIKYVIKNKLYKR